jgi:hypothetical protein
MNFYIVKQHIDQDEYITILLAADIVWSYM